MKQSKNSPEPSFVFPQNISQRVLDKWQNIRTKGITIPGVYEDFNGENLPSWWDAERIKQAQRIVQKDLYW